MFLYSNEIVFKGHPDKVCDQISAAILKEAMKQDKNTRAGIEVAGGKGVIFITGEMTTSANLNIEEITKRKLKEIGYVENYTIIDNIGKQSADIAQGVDIGGAGDQGMMFGFATDDTEEMLPTAMVILQKLSDAYNNLLLQDNNFLPDGKAQITGLYDDNFKLLKIKDFVISYQNKEECREKTDKTIKEIAINIAKEYNIQIENFYINPTGKFLIGGFEGDAGLTGRKIVVDAYQSFANVGGGCMNGKDPTKVDFSAAHKARQIAKQFLKKYNGHRCEVQLSYAIGIKYPCAIYITVDDKKIEVPDYLYEECIPSNIINDLKLKEIDFEKLAEKGHFIH